MKKIFALLLAVTMLFSLTVLAACNDNNPEDDTNTSTDADGNVVNNGNDGNNDDNAETDENGQPVDDGEDNVEDGDGGGSEDEFVFPEEISPEVQSSRALALISLLDGDTYAFETTLVGFDFKAFRKGDDILITLGGVTEAVIGDRKYTFNEGESEAYYYEADEQSADSILGTVASMRSMIQFGGAEFVGTGTAKFMKEGELEYEEFKQADDQVKRVFFDENGNVVGILFNNDVGVATEMRFVIHEEIPEDAIKIPEGYKEVYRPQD